jgi:hypothetical protein
MKKKPDNICRLRYRLEPKENDVVEFQILEQDERLRHQELVEFEGIKIEAIYSPLFCPYERKVFLRAPSHHNEFHVESFTGHRLIPSIHKALEEMVKSIYGNCKRIEE